MADHHFLLATRDTGYRGLAASVAELIDNAIQAAATDVRVLVREGRDSSSPDRALTIAVLDNGRGMDREGLWTAIQFGGTERFNDRSGLGRFGMGLPNSSVSVTRRFEVYSWKRWGDVLHTYLDIDEVAERQLPGVPEPTARTLPGWTVPMVGRSGTLVVWTRCDRLDYKRVSTVAAKLQQPLGRIYRRLIWQGLRLWVNEEPVTPTDPLFCHPDTGEGSATAYGGPLTYDITLPGSSRTARVTVRFTELPVAQWHALSVEEKRARGIVGEAGVSFVRAGREIDYGWRLLGGKRRENYDDWWRCEVVFEPDLDEHFGVTHSKQGVDPTPYLRSILEPDLEAAARSLNARVRAAFEAIKRTAPSEAAARATRQDHLLPPLSDQAKSTRKRGGLRYAIGLAPIPGPHFFEATEERGEVRLTINTDHPFYERLYAPAVADPSGVLRSALECLLLAAARAGLAAGPSAPRAWGQRFQREWSDALAAFLETKGCRA
ncbi:MAG: ATP-binding protein [Gemmatimonadetes bacterium]|nr:ATP-binding protein [Gemmatimonadota bacterium]